MANETLVTWDLGSVYFARKELERIQADLRLSFFEEATRSFGDKNLARQSVIIPPDRSEDPTAYVSQYYPEWTVLDVGDPDINGTIRVAIQENPEFKPYTQVAKRDPWEILDEVNPKTVYGYVITRSIVAGSMLLDDDRLKLINPKVYEQVTEWENASFISRLGYAESRLKKVGWPRVVKDLDDFTPREIESIKPFLYQKKPTVKLLVRYAKEDD